MFLLKFMYFAALFHNGKFYIKKANFSIAMVGLSVGTSIALIINFVMINCPIDFKLG